MLRRRFLLAPEQIDWQEPAEAMPSSVPPEAGREASAVVLRCTQCYWVESHPANEEPRCTHCGGSAEVLQPVLPAVEEDILPAGQDPRVSAPAASFTVPSVVPSVAAETRPRAGKATVFQPASSFPPARERKTITTVRPDRPEQKAPAGQLAGTQISGTQATSARVSGAQVSRQRANLLRGKHRGGLSTGHQPARSRRRTPAAPKKSAATDSRSAEARALPPSWRTTGSFHGARAKRNGKRNGKQAGLSFISRGSSLHRGEQQTERRQAGQR